MAPNTPAKKMVGLPDSVTSPVDLGRLLRELDAIDAVMLQAKLTAGEVKLPKTSIFMDQAVEMNKLDLTASADRQALKAFLLAIRDRAPRLHVSFSADPSEQFITKITLWLRKSVHPLVLLTIGLQPGIGAGCMVRTTNKYFDLSLSQQLAKQRPLLMQKLQEYESAAVTGAAPVVVTDPAVAPTPEAAA